MPKKNKRINFTPAALPIASIMNRIKNVEKNGLDLKPDYQREYIWSHDFQEKLMYSILKNYPIGSIIIRDLEEPNKKNARSEVVDGQQRLTTIFNFINNEVEIENEVAKNIVKENKDYFEEDKDNPNVKKILKRYNDAKKITIKYSDLPEGLKANINDFPLAITQISNATTEQVSEYFRFVQNQERLRAGEIIESFPDTILEKYLDAIEDKQKLLSILNFEDSRKEFEKIFYSMIGLFDNKINFGSTDNKIKDYVNDKKEDLTGEALEYTNRMITNLNIISTIKQNEGIRCNKRILKFLLLLSALEPVDIEKNKNKLLPVMHNIDEKLSAFNSAKKEAIQEAFQDENATDKEIEEYRLLSLIAKGGHHFTRVQERIELLGTILKKKLK